MHLLGWRCLLSLSWLTGCLCAGAAEAALHEQPCLPAHLGVADMGVSTCVMRDKLAQVHAELTAVTKQSHTGSAESAQPRRERVIATEKLSSVCSRKGRQGPQA